MRQVQATYVHDDGVVQHDNGYESDGEWCRNDVGMGCVTVG